MSCSSGGVLSTTAAAPPPLVLHWWRPPTPAASRIAAPPSLDIARPIDRKPRETAAAETDTVDSGNVQRPPVYAPTNGSRDDS